MGLKRIKHRELQDIVGGTFPHSRTVPPPQFKFYMDSAGFSMPQEKLTNLHTFSNTQSPFSIGKYPVTYELWYAVRIWAEENGYIFGNKGMEGARPQNGEWPLYTGVGEKPSEYRGSHPVTNVNFADVIVWLNAYSEMEGLVPVYYSDAEFQKPYTSSTRFNPIATAIEEFMDENYDAYDTESELIEAMHDELFESGELLEKIPKNISLDLNLNINTSANGYRLPTETEWQIAARFVDDNTLADPLCNDYDTSDLLSYAYLQENSDECTYPVGSKRPTASGLHDMLGLVREWCIDIDEQLPEQDSHAENFCNSKVSSILNEYPKRVLCGGSINDTAETITIATSSIMAMPSCIAHGNVGFRVAK